MRDLCRSGASAISQAEYIKALQMASDTSAATISKRGSDFAFPLMSLSSTLLEAGTVR